MGGEIVKETTPVKYQEYHIFHKSFKALCPVRINLWFRETERVQDCITKFRIMEMSIE